MVTVFPPREEVERLNALKERLESLYDLHEEDSEACALIDQIVYDAEWLSDRLLVAWATCQELQDGYNRALAGR